MMNDFADEILKRVAAKAKSILSGPASGNEILNDNTVKENSKFVAELTKVKI
jgi:hypothetical protein